MTAIRRLITAILATVGTERFRCEPAQRYVYEPERGPMPSSNSASDLSVSGQTLLDLAADEFERPETRDEARTLLRALIGMRLHGQVLHTRTVLRELSDL